MKIFITGGTGFIGSHVVRAVLGAGHEVVALKRKQSSLARCGDFSKRVFWVDADASDWIGRVNVENPEAIIHCAWAGVSAAGRADWNCQAANLALFVELLQIAGAIDLKHFVAFGSQAEYGDIHGRVTESHSCQPNTAYGATKLACLALLEGFTRQKKISWVWLRLFSIYGPNEGGPWFIPSLIRQMLAEQSPRLTPCEQRYDYLYVKDLARGVLAALANPQHSGIFNLSSNSSIQLKEVVKLIRQYTGCIVEPHFGALPYRPGQVTQMEGDSMRFYKDFSFCPETSIHDGLRQLVAEAKKQT